MHNESDGNAFEQRLDARMKELLEDTVAAAEGPFYHYTRAEGLMGILGERVVHATHYRFLNDSSEISLGEENVKEVVRSLLRAPEVARHHATLEQFAVTYEDQRLSRMVGIYVASFTQEGDLLSQWRAYGANGGGYSLGLSRLDVDHATLNARGIGTALYRCDYEVETFRSQLRAMTLGLLDAVEEHAHLLAGANKAQLTKEAVIYLLQAAMAFVPALKHVSFQEEREWRLVAFRLPHASSDAVDYRACQRRGLVPFIRVPFLTESPRLPVAEVVLGPTHEQQAAREALRGYLVRLGYGDAEDLVKVSSIPYRG